MANRPISHYPDIGALGEELVAQWLQSTGRTILHRRWRSRWGEIDLVALEISQEAIGGQRDRGEIPIQNFLAPSLQPLAPTLAFVEVKTRSRRNWDAGGLLAITPHKQAKLWQTAQCYLSAYPNLAEYTCRFDVALVEYRKLSNRSQEVEFAKDSSSVPMQLGQALSFGDYQLVLQEYLPSAFD